MKRSDLPPYRFLRSVQENGLRRTISISISALEDWWFDVKNGTDTAGIVNLEDLDVTGPRKQNGHRYQATSTRPLTAFLSDHPFPTDSVLVDFGSGKGKVLLVAAGYGFARLVGVEFSPALCAIARKNVSLAQRRAKIADRIHIVESDVVDYPIRPEENVFFFYNPFGEMVLNSVLRNILRSLEDRPRRIWCVYYSPGLPGRVYELGSRFVEVWHGIYFGSELVVYSNEGNACA